MKNRYILEKSPRKTDIFDFWRLLTGRNTKLTMFPPSIPEMVDTFGKLHTVKELNNYFIYGLYPAVTEQENNLLKIKVLEDLANDYLYKDLFTLGDIRNRFAFKKVVEHFALRIGTEIHYEDIAKDVGISADTVQHYATLLEDAFIIFRVRPYYTNKLNEITKSHKIYFYDVGIRNAIIGNYKAIESREDKGHIFENFFIAEKIKENSYQAKKTSFNFWRKKSGGGEVDLVETTLQGGIEKTWEIKWRDNAKLPLSFKNTYGEKDFTVVNKDNIVDLLTNLTRNLHT